MTPKMSARSGDGYGSILTRGILIAAFALTACADDRPTSERRESFILACQDHGSNVVDCTDSAYRLYPDEPQKVAK